MYIADSNDTWVYDDIFSIRITDYSSVCCDTMLTVAYNIIIRQSTYAYSF